VSCTLQYTCTSGTHSNTDQIDTLTGSLVVSGNAAGNPVVLEIFDYVARQGASAKNTLR
jgi:hypothetical protein